MNQPFISGIVNPTFKRKGILKRGYKKSTQCYFFDDHSRHISEIIGVFDHSTYYGKWMKMVSVGPYNPIHVQQRSSMTLDLQIAPLGNDDISPLEKQDIYNSKVRAGEGYVSFLEGNSSQILECRSYVILGDYNSAHLAADVQSPSIGISSLVGSNEIQSLRATHLDG